MPEPARRDLEARDLGLAAGPANDAAIGHLPAATGIERRVGEHDLPRPRIGDSGLERQRLGMIMTIEMHSPHIGRCRSSVLVKIVVIGT